MEILSKIVDDVLVIEIKGQVMGKDGSQDFQNVLYDAIENDHIRVVVDLKDASWMNSSGLGMLIGGLSTIRSSGGDIRLANVPERVRRPLEITRLESVFLSFNSVPEAIESYKNS